MIQLMFPNAGQELIRRLARHLLAFAFFVVPVEAQQSFQVYNATDLSNALAQAFSDSLNDSGITDTIVLDDNISSTSEFILNANVNILGNAYSIDMNNADRAFFIAGGRVGISNLTIQDGNASGGEGSQGGGGGAGLGGAIFIGSGTYLGGVDHQGVESPSW